MSFFVQDQASSPLYVATAPGAGWLGYVVLDSPTSPTLELSDALAQTTGAFVFSARVPDLSPPAARSTFIAAVQSIVSAQQVQHGFLWIPDPANPTAAAPVYLAIN